MNVLLIIEGTYPWYRGGVSEWVYQYLSHFSDFQFTILQIATDEFQDLDPSEALYPIPKNVAQFERISPPEIAGDWQNYLEKWYQHNEAKFYALLPNLDVVHVTNTGFAGWLGSRLCDSHEIPMILTEHAIYWKEIDMGAVALECGYKIPQTKRKKNEVSSSFKDIASYTYSTAQHIITVSQSNIPFQKELGASDIHYIPNGVPHDWLIEEKKRGKVPVIGWVGRCAEMKNPLAFFDFIESFKVTDLTPQFIILLSSANEENLEQKVFKRAKEFPNLKMIWNKSSKNYFKCMDMLAITSHNESQPLVMLEALAHKVLPIGRTVGDLTAEYGLVFGSNTSYEVIAEEVEHLWMNPQKFNQKVESGFELLQQNHVWFNIFNSYRLLLEETIQKETV